ncbi:glycosyltransferase family 4 protein [Marinobacterium mangrovicola]|uniref:Glycosyltransferase involved in cell wall biosynthesis n=1 Tax=Marinobacterium mangrovicola TaxID=1476959 RepID=A0A4R1GDI8_9GAMM|nr:glycosyltransferase family 4 protein [Marinobacterium mangrovicola]TCK04880.1 glycosyltransferase involved in cell wall biosynthesis [Marinobacterium mangrovicola]
MIALVLKGYPRLSETFIAQEILALERRGLKMTIVSLRHPTDKAIHPIHKEIQSPVLYLPEYLHQEPWRVFKGLVSALAKPGFGKTLGAWIKDLRRDFTRNRARRFGQALVLAREMPESTSGIYTHFIHTPGSVGRYASLLTQRSWFASAHAKDIWTQPEWEIREKLVDLEWLVTCTAANKDYLAGLSPDPAKVELVYHGIDFSRFPNLENRSARTHDGRDGRVELISVGRAVEKKGYDLLLSALAALPPELNWHFTHIGGGALADKLRNQANELGLSERITWLGAQPQTEVLARYREADLFVLPSRITADGDRDGLPNVLMEAQSQGLSCLATNISGIPELIINGETGTLVEQNDLPALTAALEHLITHPDERNALAEAGLHRVHRLFSFERGIDHLMAKFDEHQQPVSAQACESS